MNTTPEHDALVPLADRPFVPVDEMETVQETVWYNPTEKDCAIEVYVGTRPLYSEGSRAAFRSLRVSNPLQYRESKTGLRTYIIKAGHTRAISSEFDQAIQQTVCLETECVSRKLYCRDRTHHHRVMGGLGPQLVNKSVQYRPALHPTLVSPHTQPAPQAARAPAPQDAQGQTQAAPAPHIKKDK